jgi:hypothetical protein
LQIKANLEFAVRPGFRNKKMTITVTKTFGWLILTVHLNNIRKYS